MLDNEGAKVGPELEAKANFLCNRHMPVEDYTWCWHALYNEYGEPNAMYLEAERPNICDEDIKMAGGFFLGALISLFAWYEVEGRVR